MSLVFILVDDIKVTENLHYLHHLLIVRYFKVQVMVGWYIDTLEVVENLKVYLLDSDEG